MMFARLFRPVLAGLALLPVFGSEPAAWSPENADLLFASNRDGNMDIFLKQAGSTAWKKLTDHSGKDHWPEWSPDGTQILFQSNRNGNLDIWIMNADGTNQRALTTHPGSDFLPAWSPDGKEISFSSKRQELLEKKALNFVYAMNADGTNQRRLFLEPTQASGGVGWSPDRTTFLLDKRFDKEGADVYIVNPKGELVLRLTQDGLRHNGAPVFSPDGSHVTFYSDSPTGSSIMVCRKDGSDKRTLVSEGRNWFPRWSPDGKWVLYTTPKKENRNDLDLMAISLEPGAKPISLINTPSRDTEGRWRSR